MLIWIYEHEARPLTLDRLSFTPNSLQKNGVTVKYDEYGSTYIVAWFIKRINRMKISLIQLV